MQTLSETKPLPFFYIGKGLTEERVGLYQGVKLSLLSEAIEKADTKNIWYSREHISKLLEEIDYAGGDGVRVYFGSYESSHEYAGQTCLVMNVTREENNNGQLVHRDVIVENEADFENRSSVPRDIILFHGDECESVRRDFNYGSPCPPRCDPPPGSGGTGDPVDPGTLNLPVFPVQN